MMNGRRVVITGKGIYSTIGLNCDAVLDSLRQGRSGIGFEQRRKDLGFRSGLTGVIERPDLKNLLNRRMRIGLPEQGEYAYMATMEALKSANLELHG
jgi:3-oxoacyl-[acyl-carrier-protein] synthase I